MEIQDFKNYYYNRGNEIAFSQYQTLRLLLTNSVEFVTWRTTERPSHTTSPAIRIPSSSPKGLGSGELSGKSN